MADFGSTVHSDSSYARNGDPIGTPIFRSPEAHLQMKWGTATDSWSFGAMVSPGIVTAVMYRCQIIQRLTFIYHADDQPHVRGRISYL